MLINFSIQNFGSIKEKQTLSFEADKSRHLEDYYVIHTNGLRLLKLGLIYGANASGKTTILKALDFLRTLVLNPKSQKTETFDFEPFLFDENTPRQNTVFEIEFIQNDVRYLYEIELNTKSIVKEALFRFKTPNKKSKTRIFERTVNPDGQLAKIVFDSNNEIDEIFLKTLTANTLWNNSVFGGFLKTNVEQKELADAVQWFIGYLPPMVSTLSGLENFATRCIEDNRICKTAMLDILRNADFNLSDILIQKEETVPDELLVSLQKQMEVAEDKIQELNRQIKIVSDALKTGSLEFEHTVGNKTYSLPFEKESQGTQRYFGFASLLCVLTQTSIMFSIDELESSLHPDLYQHFLLSFLVNAKHSQIIATTHNREILNNKDIFRPDAIWITDKDNQNSATELYSLADFDSSVIRNTTNILNAYKLGRLGGVPYLGSYYIDINDDDEAK